jgi:peptidyl-prolyl cis-trans isomerase-like protein 2
LLTSNSSFITYRAAKHLDRKHTIFGKIVGGMDVLSQLENAPTDSDTNRPKEALVIEDIVVYLDPFEEFLKSKQQREDREKALEEIKKAGGIEDEKVTWTGKRVRADGTVDHGEDQGSGVGKYLRNAGAAPSAIRDEIVEDWDTYEEPKKKKAKARGFGNFDSW